MVTLTTASRPFYKVKKNYTRNVKLFLINNLILITLIFTLLGKALLAIDPAAGVLDIGILTLGVFGLLVGVAAILCSLWLQELLWQPFKAFRKEITNHFNKLTIWQQCILYFSAYFLLLYALLIGMAVVF